MLDAKSGRLANQAHRGDTRFPGRGARGGGRRKKAAGAPPKDPSQLKIILEDESVRLKAQALVREAVKGQRRARPLSAAELEAGLFQRDEVRAERFARGALRRRVSLLANVGREGLIQAVQQVAVLYEVLEQAAEAQREAVLINIRVNPKSAAPLTEIFNSLMGLPDAAVAGEVAVHAARTRHSKYAQTVLGARSLGIPADRLAEEARKPGGLDRLAEAKRTERRRERHQRGVPDKLERAVEEPPAVQSEPALERANQSALAIPKALRQPAVAAEEAVQPVPAFAKAAVAKRIAQFTSVSIQVVKGGSESLELLGRIRLPPHIRTSEPAAALRWVQAAIAAAVRAEGEG